MAANKKLAIWAPYRGHVGVIKSAENYARICRDLGFEVSFIELCDEWSSYAPVADDFPIRSLTQSARFNNIGKSNRFHRRDFYAYSLLKIPALRRALKDMQPDIVISMLGTVPLAIAGKNTTTRLIGSVQGFPKFLEKTAATNSYLRFEDRVRARLWRRIYNRLDEVICMTPNTRDLLSAFLGRECVTCPNPLFHIADAAKKLPPVNVDKPIDFVAVGRFAHQKRFDLSLQFFVLAQKQFPEARLHFFGDIEASHMQPFMTADIDPSRIMFHGFVSDLWRVLANDFNPIHLVASAWEEGGHAILEGLNAGIPTLFINPEANYAADYNGQPASFLAAAAWDEKSALDGAVGFAVADENRQALKTNIAGQFTFDSVSVRLQQVLNV